MRIDVRFHNITRKEELETYAKERFETALDRFEAHIGPVMLHLDRNGTAEIVCHVTAHVLPSTHLDVEARNRDSRPAIDEAAHKIAHAVEKSLSKRRAGRHANAT